MNSTNQQDTNIGAQALDSRGKFRHVVGGRRQPARGIVYLTLCDRRVSVVLKPGQFRHVPPCPTCVQAS